MRNSHQDDLPAQAGCGVMPAGTCSAYLRHIDAGEILGARLITIHNLHYYLGLMGRTDRDRGGDTPVQRPSSRDRSTTRHRRQFTGPGIIAAFSDAPAAGARIPLMDWLIASAWAQNGRGRALVAHSSRLLLPRSSGVLFPLIRPRQTTKGTARWLARSLWVTKSRPAAAFS
jgi:hypothetical protein